MLQCYYSLNDLDFSKLMQVYSEGNLLKTQERNGPATIAAVEQEFYNYLADVFFRTKRAFYAVWVDAGTYISAVRVEPYCDGVLLSALETCPEMRHAGYAQKLIRAIQKQFLEGNQQVQVYAHISRNNHASICTHTACDFQKILDYAIYLDGTVSSFADTFAWNASIMNHLDRGKKC